MRNLGEGEARKRGNLMRAESGDRYKINGIAHTCTQTRTHAQGNQTYAHQAGWQGVGPVGEEHGGVVGAGNHRRRHVGHHDVESACRRVAVAVKGNLVTITNAAKKIFFLKK